MIQFEVDKISGSATELTGLREAVDVAPADD